ncbi:heavy-metal-associated domain-containing protein [Rufibacter roseus]|uniref:Heavy-metal-associated domain-containing protein n=1 Tax=Rufibacter roseus TaxID=1567108 RepID=A0ABW2DQ24_9BACT|nr:heavy metal-associated domain-containing protein [Rufibacter roseus]
MKTLKAFTLSLLMVCLSTFSFAQSGKNGEVVKFKTSAVCGMCKATLEKGMAYEKGVSKATLDENTKVLTIQYNGTKTDVAKLRKAVNDLGYDADDSPATKRAYDRLDDCCKKEAGIH